MHAGDSILIAEDSATQAERLRYVLNRAYPRLDIHTALNGAEGIEIVHKTPIALVISDVVMPVMDGYEMCSLLKQESASKDIPIILLTSLSDPVDIIQGLNAGADYYLTKPYDDEFLLRKVDAILRNPQGAESDGAMGWKVRFAGEEHRIHADLQQMLNLLLSTYESAVEQNRKLRTLQEQLREANEGLEERVRERTAELSRANTRLQIEIGVREHAQEQLCLQLKRLDALRRVDCAITSSLDLRVTLNVLLDEAVSQLDVDAASVLLVRPLTSVLEFAAGRGFHSRLPKLTRFDFAKGPAGEAVRSCAPIRIDDLKIQKERPLPDKLLEDENFASYMAVPLIAKGRAGGVLELYHRDAMPNNDEWLGFLETLAAHAAVALDSARLFEDVQRSNARLLDAYETTLEGWSHALDLRDKETEGHSLRVTELTERIAKRMNVSEYDFLHMRRGALLHDIGKLGVPDAILRKPGALTAEEREIMQRHPVYAYEWLFPITFLRPALDIPYCHHEKWDGTGYPQGLRAERIPVAARIFALADIWDATRSDRPYRAAWSQERCLENVRSLRGNHLDPMVVDAFEGLYAEYGTEIDSLPC